MRGETSFAEQTKAWRDGTTRYFHIKCEGKIHDIRHRGISMLNMSHEKDFTRQRTSRRRFANNPRMIAGFLLPKPASLVCV
jgi:hypothetical protein